MKTNIFEFKEYKVYLRLKLEELNKEKAGQKSALAQFIQCQTTYVSRVLNAEAHLNLEQGNAVNLYFEHSKEESHYFLLLIQYNRAGTTSLKKYFKDQIEEIINNRLKIKSRIKVKETLNENDKARYYSEWFYAAIHMMVQISDFKTKEAIAKKLSLSIALVNEVLDFLTSVGLIIKEKQIYLPSTLILHLNSESHYISQHHRNWRLKALQSLEKKEEQNLHYSSVMTCSEEDSIQIRSMMLKTIEEIREVIRNSVGEKLCCYNLDLFEI